VLVHDSTLRVPLVIRAPGLRREGSIDDPVSLIDVMPTVLGLFGLPIPDAVQGRDLGPLLRGGTIPWSPTAGYAESLYAMEHHGTAPLTALREPGWKLIRGATEELYDLVADPGELRDRSAEDPARRDAMSAALQTMAAALVGGQAETLELDEKSRRALEGLGYVWSRPAPGTDPAASGAPPRDPREALRSMRLMADADRAARGGDLDAATAGYRSVIAAEPASIDARIRLAQILLANGRGDEAVALLVEAVELAAHEPLLHRKLGRALEGQGSFESALAAYDAGLARHPGERDLRDGRWRCLNRLGRLQEMLVEAERAVAADPTDGMARFARAVACCSHPLSAYIAALERELAELPGDPVLEAALAQARASTN
jgi:tetratricopeptide (TPR) repeat protein